MSHPISDPAAAPPATDTFDLVGDQRLLLERSAAADVLRLVAADGQIQLTIVVTPDGPVLRVEGGGLMIQAAGPLAIDAQCVAIHGREGVLISSGGDASVQVAGDLTTDARSQTVSAYLGDVTVRANDDVRLQGERVRSNC